MIDTDALKANIDILDVLNWLGLDQPSPWHRTPRIRCPLGCDPTKRPALAIYEATDSWYCFRCNVGGDVIDLVQAVKGLSFLDAAQWVADRAGAVLNRVEARERPATALVEPVASQAHADVVRWVRALGPSVALADAVFIDYDETMRAYDAKEIDAKAAIKRLIEWRMKWKDRLDV
jgi:hypothetical protein